MRYTTTDGPKKPLNAIQEGSLGDKMGIAERFATLKAEFEEQLIEESTINKAIADSLSRVEYE